MPTVVATPGTADANSYGTVEEADDYFDSRVAIEPAWVDIDPDVKAALLINATRILDALNVARRTIRSSPKGYYYYTSRAWTGLIATNEQALAWPRVGMFDRLGRPIASDVVPIELKQAEFELAGALAGGDRTLDNPVALQGITSVKAGSVAVTFKDSIQLQILPEMVLNLLPPSWLTDELIEYTGTGLIFEAR